jgi:hypothetical protein
MNFAVLSAFASASAASPLPVATGQPVTAASSDGCPPGTYRDPKGVADAKSAYVGSASALEKAIAAVPCVGGSSTKAQGGDPTSLSKPANPSPAALQPPGSKPAEGHPPVSQPHP